MPFFPNVRDNNNGWHFDVIGLLAVIGESSMAMHSQPLTSSWLCRLPRLIPAPQALLKSLRPYRLPTATGLTVMGVYGGTMVDELNYYANLIHDVESVAPYDFQSYEIEYREKNDKLDEEEGWDALGLEPVQEKDENSGEVIGGNNILPFHNQDLNSSRPSTPKNATPAPESSPEHHKRQHRSPSKSRATPHERSSGQSIRNAQDTVSPSPPKKRPTNLSNMSRAPVIKHRSRSPPRPPADPDVPKIPTIPSKTFSPLNILTVFSFLLFVGLIVWAVLIRDGVAIIALCTISFASSIICYASEWEPKLARRPNSAPPIPNGDIVIKTRGGAFIVVKCPEEIARELYTGTERCKYIVGEQLYRILIGAGTVLLMVSVVLLGNCEWTMQAAIGAVFILLNGLYWAVALMPSGLHWDMSRYKWTETTPEHLRNAHDPDTASFTRTMWYAIQHTKEVKWITDADFAPKHSFWGPWLDEALKNAEKDNKNWPAVERKNELMREYDARGRKERKEHESRRMSLVDEEGLTTGTAGSPTTDQNRLIVRGAGENIVG